MSSPCAWLFSSNSFISDSFSWLWAQRCTALTFVLRGRRLLVQPRGAGGRGDAARGPDVCNYILISPGATVQSGTRMCKINLRSLYDGPVFTLFNFVYGVPDSCLPGAESSALLTLTDFTPTPQPSSQWRQWLQEGVLSMPAALLCIGELSSTSFYVFYNRFISWVRLSFSKKIEKKVDETSS